MKQVDEKTLKIMTDIRDCASKDCFADFTRRFEEVYPKHNVSQDEAFAIELNLLWSAFKNTFLILEKITNILEKNSLLEKKEK